MSLSKPSVIAATAFTVGIVAGVLVRPFVASLLHMSGYKSSTFSLADQKKRFALQKQANIVQAMDIDSLFDGSSFKGLTVLVTGGNRGLGFEIVKHLHKYGAKVITTVRKASKDLEKIGIFQVVEGIDVTSDAAMDEMIQTIKAKNADISIDVLINNAGYFYGPVETLKDLAFDEELKMIDICAIGSLRVTSALYKAEILKKGAKIAMITSQGGSISWRDVQNPEGHDYGHHMSKAASNMMGKLVSQELGSEGIAVAMLHPGFNRTDMTAKYKDIWDEEGAVPSETGAKRVLYEIEKMSLISSGQFINCEDGKQIPW